MYLSTVQRQLERSTLARTLRTIPGFGIISCAELAGEIGALERFPTEGSLAMYLGMAPLDRSSGLAQRGRSARQVNTRARLAMLTGSAHHARSCPESREYYLKKRREGKKHNRAVRALGRHLVRVIWSMLHQGRTYQIRSAQGEPGGEAPLRPMELGAVCLEP